MPQCGSNKHTQETKSKQSILLQWKHHSRSAAPWWHSVRQPGTGVKRDTSPLHPRIIAGAENNPVSTEQARSGTASIFSRKMSWYKSDLEWIWWNDRQRDKSLWRCLFVCLSCYHDTWFIHETNTFRVIYLSWLENISRIRQKNLSFFSQLNIC